ncbi:MAG: RNA polymerase sigma factor SigZ [Nitrospiraceae bacterium]
MTQNTAAIWAEVHEVLRLFIAKRVANQAEVDDLLQEIFLRVHRQLSRVKDPGRVVSWLYQIARNAIVDYYRSSERRREIPAGLASDVDERASAPLPSTDVSGLLRTELAACIRPMVDRLSHDYRDAVMLVELDGLTQQAAAERLGLSLSGMKSRVQRGRKQLKEMLNECCLIQLDRRRGVAAYRVRDRKTDPCGGSMSGNVE